MAYDPRCYDLARVFLSDFQLSPSERKEETDRLAQAIQTAIEAELEALEHRRIA